MASNVFPNDDIFSSLRSCAERFPGTCINNSSNGISTSYTQLIQNIVATRKSIRDALPASHFDNRGQLLDKSIWIGLQAPLSEDFVVGCLAILSVGGAVMPIAIGILQEEVDHFLEQTKCALLLTPSKSATKGHQIREPTPEKAHRHIQSVAITCSHADQCADDRAHLQIDETLKIPSNRPGLILFTSGTTGPPKGAVLPRHALHPRESCTEANRRVHLSDRMVHWIGGVICTLPPLLEGHIIQVLKPGSSAEEYWELIKQQRVTKVVWGPMALAKLKQYYDDNFKDLTSTEIEPYVSGARAIQEMCIGSAMPTASLQKFWESLVDAPLVMRYASTESGGLISTLSKVIPSKPSIGRPLPGVDMKLSEGKNGEILIKGPRVMLYYLNNEKATKAAFDDKGYFRTGDLAHMEGDEFIFEGRASSDFVQVYAYRVPVIPVENGLLNLPYVAEAVIVAVPDSACANQLGALLRLRQGDNQLSLSQLRADLANSLPAYTLPTKLRILHEGETVPRTATGKVNKKDALATYFIGSAAKNVETCAPHTKGQNEPTKAWDWAGLQ
ncbi:class I adenylate-forming enzyme family protein [Aspergillus homomorphus CBS 101889]|uniref:Acetyl-CoA synthetase-like protein n=1 Tax=Aspergillus homomorphus (strain CBS 101889) TaxID=1450537 RepID=A0A395HLR7_ASPHC|nr:acetyl-CoA synthetase-like protein [Aspergillus homomorphus CBS 101889]RAL08710.1 acetyl-CoA synthetase-like protein [Aspergillus homomorphus CBS 101889]